MNLKELLRGRNTRMLLWLLLAACIPELLLLLTAPITIVSREEAERNATEARRQDAEYLRTHPEAKVELRAMKGRLPKELR
jgi:hypothetical protein